MFKVVGIGNPEWVAAVMNLAPNRRDIHMDARLLAPYTAAYGWEAGLAISSNNDGHIIQPILITKERELRHAYNFGGPMGSTDLLNSRAHVYDLNQWAINRGIEKQYCTLVPNLIQEQLRLLSSSDVLPEYRKQSVIIDLHNQKIRGTTRRLANKAQSAGVIVKSYPLDYLKHFIEIYNVTMDRVKAKDHWYFSDKWFEAFARLVKPCLMLAEYEGQFEAGCLIAYSQQYPVAYYHFAGSLNNHPNLGINHLMVLAACEFVKSAGIPKLYLGGGVTNNENDSLLIFKAGFSQLKVPVYSYSGEINVENNPERMLVHAGQLH